MHDKVISSTRVLLYRMVNSWNVMRRSHYWGHTNVISPEQHFNNHSHTNRNLHRPINDHEKKIGEKRRNGKNDLGKTKGQ
jgi:hypothetical protein